MKSDNMKVTENWLIIQLSRFGDTMQSSPVINEAVLSNPNLNIDLLVDESNLQAAQLLSNVRHIYIAPRVLMLKNLDNPSSSWMENVDNILKFKNELGNHHYKRIINLTHSLESAYWASLFQNKEVRGLKGKRNGVVSADVWGNYFKTVSRNRLTNPFHLIDIHKKIAGLGCLRTLGSLKVPRESIERWRIILHLNRSNIDQRVIALQFGAASKLRSWSWEKLLETANVIHSRTASKFVLLGNESEKGNAEYFKQKFAGDAIDLTGQTSILDLASVLSLADLLISNDTGTLHLATNLNLRSVSIFLGMARPEDTAPYMAGEVVYKPNFHCYPCPENNHCSHLSCHNEIPASDVATTSLKILNGEEVKPLATSSFQRGITTFDENGMLTVDWGLADNLSKSLKNCWLENYQQRFNLPDKGEVVLLERVRNTTERLLSSLSRINRGGNVEFELKHFKIDYSELFEMQDFALPRGTDTH